MKAATISTTGNEARASTAGDEATASGDGAMAWHALAADDVVRRLDTDTETGLDAAAISRRLENSARTACRRRTGRGRSCAS
jgi:hypothetical protein